MEGRWIPDAFVGPMGALMKAIDENEEPENSGEEHLKDLAAGGGGLPLGRRERDGFSSGD